MGIKKISTFKQILGKSPYFCLFAGKTKKIAENLKKEF